MLVGNKSDLENQRKIPKEMGELFAEEEGLLFGEASAKSGEGVEGLFMEIGTFLLLLSFFSPCILSCLGLYIIHHSSSWTLLMRLRKEVVECVIRY
jgi:GTPase SAR1 family protein